MYAEHIKETEGVISVGKQMLLDIYIPGVSVCGLLAVTVYVLIETIDVLLHPTPEDAVDVYFLYGFASANFVIDVLCISLFAARGSGALLEEKEVLDPLTSTKQPTELRESELGANYAATDSDVGRVEHSVRSFGYAEGVRAEVSPQHRVKDDGNEDDNSEAEFEAAMILSKNINMMSALTHVSGDTLRTVSVFVSAIVASVTDVPTSVCDAWAAVVVSLTILGIVIPLLREILLSVTKHCCKISTSALDNEYGL
jgi:Co/Zn/Cd efflux system component